jgi:uncharacterized protein
MTMNNNLRIDLNTLRGAAVGERVEFEREVAKPKLGDLEKPESLSVSGYVEALEDRWLVSGSAEVTVELTCVRCLREFRQTVSCSFAEEFSRKPTGDQFPAEQTRIDLTEMLRAVLVLAVPDRPLHSSDCKGLCDICGKDLNTELHTHKKPGKPSPFESLKRLRK